MAKALNLVGRGSLRPFAAIALRLLGAFVCLFVSSTVTADAHQLDEYIQSTLVSINPNEIHFSINLTPGTAIAEKLLTQIDTDHDQAISTNEATAYCNRLKHDLTITLDHQPLSLCLTAQNFPDVTELTNGFGMIQCEFTAISPLPQGQHQLTISNQHLPGLSAYLVNAAKPSSAQIQIISQIRNQTQSTTTIAFTYRPPVARSKGIITFALLAVLYCAMFTSVWRLQKRHS